MRFRKRNEWLIAIDVAAIVAIVVVVVVVVVVLLLLQLILLLCATRTTFDLRLRQQD